MCIFLRNLDIDSGSRNSGGWCWWDVTQTFTNRHTSSYKQPPPHHTNRHHFITQTDATWFSFITQTVTTSSHKLPPHQTPTTATTSSHKQLPFHHTNRHHVVQFHHTNLPPPHHTNSHHLTTQTATTSSHKHKQTHLTTQTTTTSSHKPTQSHYTQTPLGAVSSHKQFQTR